MKTAEEIHESFLEPGTYFTTRDMPIREILRTRRAFINITAMMWICNRSKIDCAGYLVQGHTLIMIWIN